MEKARGRFGEGETWRLGDKEEKGGNGGPSASLRGLVKNNRSDMSDQSDCG